MLFRSHRAAHDSELALLREILQDEAHLAAPPAAEVAVSFTVDATPVSCVSTFCFSYLLQQTVVDFIVSWCSKQKTAEQKGDGKDAKGEGPVNHIRSPVTLVTALNCGALKLSELAAKSALDAVVHSFARDKLHLSPGFFCPAICFAVDLVSCFAELLDLSAGELLQIINHNELDLTSELQVSAVCALHQAREVIAAAGARGGHTMVGSSGVAKRLNCRSAFRNPLALPVARRFMMPLAIQM